MNARLAWIAAFATALPLAVETPRTEDSTSENASETRLELGGGAGYYTLIDRGCSGAGAPQDSGGQYQNGVALGLVLRRRVEP